MAGKELESHRGGERGQGSAGDDLEEALEAAVQARATAPCTSPLPSIPQDARFLLPLKVKQAGEKGPSGSQLSFPPTPPPPDEGTPVCPNFCLGSQLSTAQNSQ